MMKFLLVAINAKYIHSNLGVYSIRKYVGDKLERGMGGGARPGGAFAVEIGEYTINHQMDDILQDIYKRGPDVVGFSCYIWNILYVLEIVRDLKKVLPRVKIWLGGPEVSFCGEQLLEREPEVDGILIGEGEETFFRLAECCLDLAGAGLEEAGRDLERGLRRIPGLVFRDGDGGVTATEPAPLLSLDDIPFPYGDLEGLEHRILYYESSRGCPFSCSYCLSSIDKSVRFRSLGLVKRELDFFLEKKVPQVKFVDRTFNCSRKHAMGIWRYLLEHDNGVTNFHFEISADLLYEEELNLMAGMRPGLIQLEIGVQSANPETILAIHRKMDLGKVKSAVARVKGYANIHQHLDLIAGLPFEGYDSFGRSFDEVYGMEPDQLQLGFLKVLKGSCMEETAERYGLTYRSRPPYEVLSTDWLSYGDVIRLKGVEEMVEVYYNSGQFRITLGRLREEFSSPFSMFEALSGYYGRKDLNGVNHSRLARYEILFAFIMETIGEADGGAREEYRDRLMCDLYLRENVKSRPSFARDQSASKEKIKQFFISEGKKPVYLPGYEGYDSRQMSKMAHVEAMGDGTLVLFDYKNRDILYGSARTVRLRIRG